MGRKPGLAGVRSFGFWLVVALFAASNLRAQSVDSSRLGQIAGAVRDTAGNPISNAEVVLLSANRRLTANEGGEFRISGVAAGVQNVFARKVGFLPETVSVRVMAGGTADVVISLRANVEQLDSVQVTARQQISARLEGFEQRRQRRNGGQFVTREQIERRAPISTSDILRYVPGIKMVDSMGTTIAISTRGAKVNLLSPKQVEACVVRVGVDGSIKDAMFSVNQVSPRDVYGVEVYAGAASMPPEFNSTIGRNAQCGLIMIWTRTR